MQRPTLASLVSLALAAAALGSSRPAHADDHAPATLTVRSACMPGRITLDQRDAGPSPATVETTVGLHRIHVDYAGGSGADDLVFANPDGKQDVTIQPQESQCRGALRRGLHFGGSFELMPGIAYVPNSNDGSFVIAPRFGFVVNDGVSPSVDLRTGLDLAFGTIPGGVEHLGDRDSTFVMVDFPLHARFNLGSVYMMGVGVDFGFRDLGGFADGFFGPWFNLGGFRMGKRGQWELDVLQIQIPVDLGTGSPTIHWGATLTYLYLPDLT